MTSYGAEETKQLRERLQSQCDRLVQQLNEIEECKDELSPEEYDESKEETVEQLKEFNETLQKLMSGDMTLVNNLGALQLAIQAAITSACPSSALKETKKNKGDLRSRLASIDKDLKNGRLAKNESLLLKEEVLKAIVQSGEKLTAEEEKFLNQLSANNSSFVQVSDDSGLSEQAIKSATSNFCSFDK